MNDRLVLEMRSITKSFYSTKALNSVNLNLYEGEIHAIVGENGAGKSTLMKILSGSYAFSTYNGDIYISGKKVNFSSTKDAEKMGIGMIHQEISLCPDMSIAENIFIGNLPRKRIDFMVNWKKIKQLSRDALESVGLAIDPNIIVRNLNTSQKQLVSIARALRRNLKILILDEPTSALTDKEVRNLFNIIRDLSKKGISCIYISHKLEEVYELADRVTILRDGNYISTYKRNEYATEQIIEDMIGRKIEQMYPKEEVVMGSEVLNVSNLSVSSAYAKRNIIDNISFSVKKGEILGIGGIVGSGRTEVLSAVFGAIRRDSGRIMVNNEKVDIKKPRDAVKHKIGLVTEDRRLSGYVGVMNIRENISLASFGKIFGKLRLKRNLEQSMTADISNKLRIKAPSIETNILNLSGGNQQKVVLAKWLMADVQILFLDEPTKGIDVGAKVEIYKTMCELAKAGVAIVMVSSELPELLAMCDRIIVLFSGKIHGSFTRDEISPEMYMKAATGVS